MDPLLVAMNIMYEIYGLTRFILRRRHFYFSYFDVDTIVSVGGVHCDDDGIDFLSLSENQTWVCIYDDNRIVDSYSQDSMIAKIALVGLDKEVNTTDSPEIHVDDPENEIDDAVNPGVGPEDGVDPEICIAFDGKDALTDSSRFDQEDCSQIGPVVNVKTGSGMVDSRLHLDCALGTGPAFGRDNINTVNPTETGSENDPATNPDTIIKWSKLHGTQTNIHTGVQIITFCQKFSYAFTVSMATDTKIEHHNYCDYSLIMNIDADAMGDKTVRTLRLHHRDRHLSNCNFDIKHDISVGGMHYEGMHSKPSEKNDENDFPSIKESQTSGCIEDYSQHLHVAANTDMTLGAVCIFAKANKDVNRSTGIEFSAFVGGDDSNIFVYTSSKFGIGTNPEVRFVLTDCSSIIYHLYHLKIS